LARPKRFELLTPRFVVWFRPLILLGSLQNPKQSGRVFSSVGADFLTFSTASDRIEPRWLGWLRTHCGRVSFSSAHSGKFSGPPTRQDPEHSLEGLSQLWRGSKSVGPVVAGPRSIWPGPAGAPARLREDFGPWPRKKVGHGARPKRSRTTVDRQDRRKRVGKLSISCLLVPVVVTVPRPIGNRIGRLLSVSCSGQEIKRLLYAPCLVHGRESIKWTLRQLKAHFTSLLRTILGETAIAIAELTPLYQMETVDAMGEQTNAAGKMALRTGRNVLQLNT
jgi:hypothetical protein